MQHFDCALEVDAAGAFDEGDVSGAEGLEEPAAGGFGIGQEEGGDSTLAGGGGEVDGVALDAGD